MSNGLSFVATRSLRVQTPALVMMATTVDKQQVLADFAIQSEFVEVKCCDRGWRLLQVKQCIRKGCMDRGGCIFLISFVLYSPADVIFCYHTRTLLTENNHQIINDLDLFPTLG